MKKIRQHFPMSIVVIICIFAFGILGYRYYNLLKPVPNKIYTNSFYHIRLIIPQNWTIKEYVNSDGQPGFTLSSPNNELTIESPLPEHTNNDYYEKQNLGNTEVPLGKFTADRTRYKNANNKIMDYISLRDIPHQQLINLFFKINGDFSKNNQKLLEILKTFSFTQQEPSLDSFITYTIPPQWRKMPETKYETDDDTIILTSPDIKESGAPYIEKGARIRINRTLENHQFSKILDDIPLNGTAQIQTVQRGNNEFINIFSCWEGCYDVYYKQVGKYIWSIGFICAPNCNTKEAIGKSIYQKPLDAFLTSLKFINQK